MPDESGSTPNQALSTPAEVPPSVASPEARRQVLQNAIQGYLTRGWRVVSQTDTTAQLIKPKQFSFLTFVLLFFACGLGIIYAAWFMAKRDQSVYIHVNEWGQLAVT